MTTLLVMAKAPVVGAVKTRLAADLRPVLHEQALVAAAHLAAAALLDTLANLPPDVDRHLALDGDLRQAVDGRAIANALQGWRVTPQRPGTFGQRLAWAHREVAGPRLQIGMDTPHVGGRLLRDVMAQLEQSDAVLGPAYDGGWWAIGLHDGAAAEVLMHVAMSQSTTCAHTRAALLADGLSVSAAPAERDLDHLDDLRAIATAAPELRVSRLARDLGLLDLAVTR